MPDQLLNQESYDMALKLSLEAGLIVSLGSLFSQIAQDFKTVYSATGQVLNAGVYNPDLTGILRTTYRKAGKTAGKTIRNEVDVISNSDVEDQADLNLMNFAEQEPIERSAIINRTTTRQLNFLTLLTIVTAALAGEFLDNGQVAKIAAQAFKKRSKSRKLSIAVTETLNGVEGARLTEANTLIQADVQVKPKKKDVEAQSLATSFFRRWHSREDDKVRNTHVLANGQTVQGTTIPFVVGGSLLMYPGDTSLGADLKEIIGCRCFTEEFIRWLNG